MKYVKKTRILIEFRIYDYTIAGFLSQYDFFYYYPTWVAFSFPSYTPITASFELRTLSLFFSNAIRLILYKW